MADYCFTASYINCAHNFIIKGIPEGSCPDQLTDSFTCVLKNILQRSRTVRPSKYLRDALGTLPECGDPVVFLYKSMALPYWHNTIKGSDDGKNPAREFFYNDRLWEKYLGDFTWIRQLLIPEASLERILEDYSGSWKDQCVDFYLPAADLVIEIDGEQHQTDPSVAALDVARDHALVGKRKRVLRIPANVFSPQGLAAETFLGYLGELRSILSQSSTVQKLNSFDSPVANMYQWEKYETVLRFQFAILQLVSNGVLALNQEVWKLQIPEDQQLLFEYAAQDLFLLYQNLFQLKNQMFQAPKIQFGSGRDYLPVMCGLYVRPDERPYNGVCILTDRWDGTDYYQVSSGAPINYEIPWPCEESDPRADALRYMMSYLFGDQFDQFRPGQWPILANILNLNRTIGILPTGGGKSLCYQLAVALQPGISFVVSPINALQIDQKRNLDEAGWERTAYIESSMPALLKQQIIEAYSEGKLQIIWISPERFQSRVFRHSLEAISHNHTVSYAVIDEVHCLSEWGHDFRTSYLNLISTIECFTPQSCIVGLTATASQAVLNDLKVEFKVDGSSVRALPSLNRENLRLAVLQTNERDKALFEVLDWHNYGEMMMHPDNGLVFTLTKDRSFTPSKSKNKLAAKIVKELPWNEDKVSLYHGELKNRKEVQDKYMSGDYTLLSTTKAFGMGVNKPDIRFTVHYNLPWSVEAFYQEAGRAGRDGAPAESFIIFDKGAFGDKEDVERMFLPNTTPDQIKQAVESKLIKSDLNTIFYLWGGNNKGVDVDVEAIHQLLGRIKGAVGFMDFGKTFKVVESDKDEKFTTGLYLKAPDLELALYRLKLLGVIEDWTVDWNAKPTRFEIIVFPKCTENSIKTSLFSYIRRYNPGFGDPWDKNTEKYREIVENLAEPVILRYARALISWTYDHIIYSRRNAIRNIYDYCNEYKGEDQFREKINNYLRISEDTITLDAIVANPKNWRLWFDVFFDVRKSEEGIVSRDPHNVHHLKGLHDTCRRYLESYQEITGLNLIYVLSGMISDDYNDNIDGQMLDNCLEAVGNYEAEDRYGISTELLQQLQIHLPDLTAENKKAWILHLLAGFPDLAAGIYEIANDPYSLMFLIQKANKKINQSMEMII